jgi:hypothetical protein
MRDTLFYFCSFSFFLLTLVTHNKKRIYFLKQFFWRFFKQIKHKFFSENFYILIFYSLKKKKKSNKKKKTH